MSAFDALLHLLEVGTLLHVTEFFLDRLDLFVEVILALTLLHLTLDATANTPFDLHNVEFGLEQRQQMLQTLFDAEHFQYVLLLLKLQGQMRRHSVSETSGLVDPGQRGQNFRRDFLVQLHVLVELRQHGAAHRLDLIVVAVFRRNSNGLADVMCTLVGDRDDLCALNTLDQNFHRSVGQFEHLQNVGNTTDTVQIFRCRFVLCGRLLGHQHDVLAGLHGHFQCLD